MTTINIQYDEYLNAKPSLSKKFIQNLIRENFYVTPFIKGGSFKLFYEYC
jgi:hypothetical protein